MKDCHTFSSHQRFFNLAR